MFLFFSHVLVLFLSLLPCRVSTTPVMKQEWRTSGFTVSYSFHRWGCCSTSDYIFRRWVRNVIVSSELLTVLSGDQSWHTGEGSRRSGVCDEETWRQTDFRWHPGDDVPWYGSFRYVTWFGRQCYLQDQFQTFVGFQIWKLWCDGQITLTGRNKKHAQHFGEESSLKGHI